jgi:iron-sulfur cluster assembly accessory protein
MSEVLQHKPLKGLPPITLTKAAEQHILSYLAKNKDSKGIRFSVKKTGCSGLSYVIQYIENLHEDDIISPINQDYILCLDKKSYPFLKGVAVDYVKQGLNYQFVFNNPNQTGQCGCGESFTVDTPEKA